MRSRPGFAIASAIAALVLIGFLVTAALFATAQESRATSAEMIDAKAFAYAEQVALAAAADWTCSTCDLLPAGSVIIRNTAALPPLEGTVYITRLDSAVYLVTGEARSESAALPLSRRVSIVVTTSTDSLGVIHAVPLSREFWTPVYPP
ncbi:MAG TPA: hypothetical protein VJL35_08070 [Gemmatimonadaceae bacterium]|jgi:Tfp pilus assembly protein PilX|nr:hypothetical protein [Gemmatimonadaceae bacterium]